MEDRALRRLETLQKLNSDRTWVNRGLYRLLYREDLYAAAGERTAATAGGNVPRSASGAIAGSPSRTLIQSLIRELRDESFQFEPFLPERERPGDRTGRGTKRRLGPSVKDRLVQGAMRMILEAIYDSPNGPYFLDTSHGYRPKRNCHTALREFRRNWAGVNWIIAGDVASSLSDMDHGVLADLLRLKIRDERFISLVHKLLRAGWMTSLQSSGSDSLAGVSREGIVSPVLVNVYLHELDAKVEAIRSKTGATSGETSVEYIRYGWMWILGVRGPKSSAQGLGEEVERFLRCTLRLGLGDGWSRIVHAGSERARFLGCDLGIDSASSRVEVRRPVLLAPVDELVAKLHAQRYCEADGFPIHNGAYIRRDPVQIVRRFGGINKGIQRYYRFADNFGAIRRIQYILRYSLAKTFAAKYKLSVRQVFDKYGPSIGTTTKGADGNIVSASFFVNRDWRRRPNAFDLADETVDVVHGL